MLLNGVDDTFRTETLGKLITLINTGYEAAEVYKIILENQKTLAASFLLIVDMLDRQGAKLP